MKPISQMTVRKWYMKKIQSFQHDDFNWLDISVICQDFSFKGSNLDIPFGVKWFKMYFLGGLCRNLCGAIAI